MANFFKNIGKGVLYFFAFPGLLIAIAIYMVVGLFIFLFQLFKLVFLFFTGRNLFSDLPEDIELKAKLDTSKEEEKVEEEPKEENNQLSLYPSDSSLYDNEYSSSMIKEKEEDADQEVVPLDVLDDEKYDGEEDK